MNEIAPEASLGCSCKCEVKFLDAHQDHYLVHQKTPPVIAAYNDLFGVRGKYPTFSPRRIVELGINRGGSVAIWRLAWPAARILGVDPAPSLSQRATEHFMRDRLVAFARNRQEDQELAAMAPPDLLIDDGSHRYGDVIASFKNLWPRVARGGFCVLEDWVTPHFEWQKVFATIQESMIGSWAEWYGPESAPCEITTYRCLAALRKRP